MSGQFVVTIDALNTSEGRGLAAYRARVRSDAYGVGSEGRSRIISGYETLL